MALLRRESLRMSGGIWWAKRAADEVDADVGPRVVRPTNRFLGRDAFPPEDEEAAGVFSFKVAILQIAVDIRTWRLKVDFDRKISSPESAR